MVYGRECSSTQQYICVYRIISTGDNGVISDSYWQIKATAASGPAVVLSKSHEQPVKHTRSYTHRPKALHGSGIVVERVRRWDVPEALLRHA